MPGQERARALDALMIEGEEKKTTRMENGAATVDARRAGRSPPDAVAASVVGKKSIKATGGNDLGRSAVYQVLDRCRAAHRCHHCSYGYGHSTNGETLTPLPRAPALVREFNVVIKILSSPHRR